MRLPQDRKCGSPILWRNVNWLYLTSESKIYGLLQENVIV